MSETINGVGFSIMGFVFGIILISLVGIASNVLLGFCVYNDAKYRRNENAVLWAVLSGFFNIVALVYIIVQVSTKNQQQLMRCVQCGEFIAPGGICCPRCGRMLDVPSPEEMEGYNRRRKLFLGLWIGSIVLVFVAAIIFAAVFMTSMISIAEYHM